MPRTILTSIATSQSGTKDIEPPSLDSDAAERKRILNVLAQRRYRRRKKLKFQSLESKVTEQSSSADKTDTVDGASGDFEYQCIDQLGGLDDIESFENGIGSEYQLLEESQPVQPTRCPPMAFLEPDDLLSTPPMRSMDLGVPTESIFNPGQAPQSSWETSNQFFSFLVTPESHPPMILSASSSKDSNDMYTSTISPSKLTNASSTMTPQHNLYITNAKMTTSAAPHLADAAHLPLSELTFLKGCIAIAERLRLADTVWDISSISPFCSPTVDRKVETYAHLPPCLRPTAAQRQIPHHPLLDLLPWPEARQKLIMVLSLPEAARPPAARGPPQIALLSLVADVEDGAEGLRVWGDDPFDRGNWEIGEKVFKNWWWAFDCTILQRSNAWRKQRGAAPLGSSGTANKSP